MLLNFNEIKELTVPGMNSGTGMVTARMYMDEQGKVILCSIHTGGSIGLHKHETSDDINYVLSGNGKAVCDGQEEILSAGTCHICKKGSEHSIVNTGNEDLVLLTVVAERSFLTHQADKEGGSYGSAEKLCVRNVPDAGTACGAGTPL